MSLDTNKTYLVWNGTEFPNSTSATFKAPAGSTIDWGDGTVETFDTASTSVNTHTYTDGKTEHTIVISGLTSIGEYAFYGCTSLTSVTIPNSITSIGNAAFALCSSLTNITIPDSVTSISAHTFYHCNNLTSVTIGNSITSIGGYAFAHCSSLTKVTIPDSVTSIGDVAFANCSSLTQLILFPSTPPTLGSNAIPNNVQSIYVRQSSKEAYQSATNWTAFASKIVSDNIYLSFVRFNGKNKEYIDGKVDELNEKYVKKTDYATETVAGAIKIKDTFCSAVNSVGALRCLVITLDKYTNRTVDAFISKGTLENIKTDLVSRSLTELGISGGEKLYKHTITFLGVSGYFEILSTIQTALTLVTMEEASYTQVPSGFLSSIRSFTYYNDTENNTSTCLIRVGQTFASNCIKIICWPENMSGGEIMLKSINLPRLVSDTVTAYSV